MAMAAAPTSNAPMPSRGVRAVVSAIVAVHVAAVFIGPFAMPPQTSELAGSLAGVFKPYVEILGLANGYRFFAPEPGPSHLIRYEVVAADGTRHEGLFPDRAHHQPRLLYHRYFMLTEFVNTLGGMDPREQLPPEVSERLKAYANGYAEHLAEQYNAQSVKLFLVRHYVPRMSEVREGRKLSDKVLYVEAPLWTLTKESDSDATRGLAAALLGRRNRRRLEPVLVHAGRPGHAGGDPHLRRRDAVLHAPGVEP